MRVCPAATETPVFIRNLGCPAAPLPSAIKILRKKENQCVGLSPLGSGFRSLLALQINDFRWVMAHASTMHISQTGLDRLHSHDLRMGDPSRS